MGAFEELRESPDEEGARIMALLGIVRGPGTVALVGGPSRHAAFLAAGVDDLHVVAVDPDLKSWPDSSGVSRLVSAPGLPFFSRMLRGVVVDGRLGEGIVAESARVLAPKSRLVVLGAGDLTRQLLVEAGLTLLAVESETVVAVRG